MPNKIAVYARVSTQEQAQEGYSIDEQIDSLTTFCKARHWAIAGIYSDPGFSGANLNRPALQKLLEDIDGGLVDCVLVLKLDRLSRSQKDTLYLFEDIFEKKNVSFVSMNESFDTGTSFGKATVGILSVFAQLEREQIKERMAMGMLGRAKAGLWHGGGYRPFGYDYAEGELTINPVEGLIVQDVYELFLQHKSLVKIQSIIEEKYGRILSHNIIHSILSTPLYKGTISWLGKFYEGQHKPLVDDDTFQRAQSLLCDRARISASKPLPFQAKHLLSGFLVCGNCGAKYFSRLNHSTNGKPLSYYTCYSRAKNKLFATVKSCKNPTYRVELLDRRIIEEILRLTDDEKYFQDAVKASVSDDSSRIEQTKKTLKKQIASLDTQISRVIDLYQIGTISLEQIGERTQKLQNEKETLKTTLQNLTAQRNEKMTVADAREVLARFRGVIENGDLESRRKILQELIQEIILFPEKGELEIRWNF